MKCNHNYARFINSLKGTEICSRCRENVSYIDNKIINKNVMTKLHSGQVRSGRKTCLIVKNYIIIIMFIIKIKLS